MLSHYVQHFRKFRSKNARIDANVVHALKFNCLTYLKPNIRVPDLIKQWSSTWTKKKCHFYRTHDGIPFFRVPFVKKPRVSTWGLPGPTNGFLKDCPSPLYSNKGAPLRLNSSLFIVTNNGDKRSVFRKEKKPPAKPDKVVYLTIDIAWPSIPSNYVHNNILINHYVDNLDIFDNFP